MEKSEWITGLAREGSTQNAGGGVRCGAGKNDEAGVFGVFSMNRHHRNTIERRVSKSWRIEIIFAQAEAGLTRRVINLLSRHCEFTLRAIRVKGQ